MIEIKRGAAKEREALTAAQNGAKQREEAREGIPPPSPPTGPTEEPTGPGNGIQGTGSPPDMLEAWREAYRIFSRYAPAIRAAAAADGPENEGAGALFCEALARVVKMCEPGGDAAILGLRVYDMLDDVWKAAREGCKNSKPEVNESATGSATDSAQPLQGSQEEGNQ